MPTNLWEEHLAGTKKIPDHIHAVHQWTLDDLQGLLILATGAGLLCVNNSKLVNAFDQGMLNAFLYRQVPPGVLLGCGSCSTSNL